MIQISKNKAFHLFWIEPGKQEFHFGLLRSRHGYDYMKSLIGLTYFKMDASLFIYLFWREFIIEF